MNWPVGCSYLAPLGKAMVTVLAIMFFLGILQKSDPSVENKSNIYKMKNNGSMLLSQEKLLGWVFIYQ
jgi:hypothetical protein